MPFEPFTEWLQLEIHRGNFTKADDLLRNYIFQSTRLGEEKSKGSSNAADKEKQNDYYKGMFGGMKRHTMLGSGGLGVNAKDLPLSKVEYYELLEVLIFYIMLPSKGFSHTVSEMKDLPMPKEARQAFEKRLIDLRNTAVADLKISSAERLISLNSVPSLKKAPEDKAAEDASHIASK